MGALDTSPETFAKYIEATRSKVTAEKYRFGVEQFLTTVMENGYEDFQSLPRGILNRYVQILMERGYSASSVSVYMAGIKRYLKWVRDQGTSLPDMSEPDMPRQNHVIRDSLSPDQLKVYFRIADELPEPSRSAVLLLPCTGLRASEMAELRLSSIRRVRVRVGGVMRHTVALRIVGKGGKERTVPVLEEGVPVLTGYLSGYRRKAPTCPWIFPGHITKKNRANIPPLATRTLRDAIVHVREPLGLKFTPHTMRRTYLTALYRRGVDPATLAKIAGHANIQTLFRHYLMLDDHDVLRAVHERGASILE